MRKFLKSFSPAILWGGTIFVLSAVPGDKLYMPPIWNADKFAHIGVYFVFAATLIAGFFYYSNCKRLNRWVILSTAIAIAFGGILEILQQHVFIGRYGDILDFTANSTGAVLAAFIARIFSKKLSVLCRY